MSAKSRWEKNCRAETEITLRYHNSVFTDNRSITDMAIYRCEAETSLPFCGRNVRHVVAIPLRQRSDLSSETNYENTLICRREAEATFRFSRISLLQREIAHLPPVSRRFFSTGLTETLLNAPCKIIHHTDTLCHWNLPDLCCYCSF